MSNRFFRSIERVVRVIEKILLRIVVLGLILLIAVQLILTNPNLEDSIVAKLPKLKEILNFGQNVPAKTVFRTKEEYLILALQNSYRAPETKVLVNAKVVGDFSQGLIKIRVQDGDKLAINGRENKKGLWVKVEATSVPLPSFKVGQQYWIKNEWKVIGEVKLNNKL